MFNLNGLNFNIDYDLLNKAREDTGTTVASMSEQADYIPSDYYVDLFADTTAPLIGTLTPNVGDMFAPLELTSQQKVDFGISPPEPVVAPVVQNQDIAQLILQMAVGSATPDLQYDLNGDGRITSYDALQYAKGAQAPATSTQTVAPTTVTQDFSPPPSIDIGQYADPFASTIEDTTTPSMDDVLAGIDWTGGSSDPWAAITQIGTNIEEASKTPEGQTVIKQMQDTARDSTRDLYEAGQYNAISPEKQLLDNLKSSQYNDPVIKSYVDQQIKLLENNPAFMSRVTDDFIAASGGFDNWWAEGAENPVLTANYDLSNPDWLDNLKIPGFDVEGFGDLQKAISDRSYALAKADDKQGTQLAKVAAGIALTATGAPALASSLGVSSAAGAGIINAGMTLATGGDIEDAVKSGLLTYAGGELGSRVQAGAEFGINPLGEQAGMLAEQSWGIGGFSPVAAAAGSMVDSAIRTGTLDPTKMISGAVVSEFGAPQLVADAVDFTKAYVEDDYASMLGIASDYVDLPSGDGLSFDTPDFLKEFDKQVLQPAKEIIEEVGSDLYEAQKPVGQAIADAGEVVYEDLVKPLGNAVTDVAQVIDDEVIDPFVSTIKDSVIDPIEEAAQAVYEEQKPIGQAIADTVEAVVEPIGDVAETVYEAQKPIGQAIADTGEVIYEDILKPVGDTIVDVGETVYEAQKPVGQAIADTGETVYEDIIKPIGTAIDDNIIDPIDQAIRDIEVPEVDLPSVDIDLPEIDLPSIDLPSIDWKGLFGSLLGFGGMMSAAAQGPTAKPSQDINIREFEDFKFTPYRSKLSPKASTLGRRV